MKEISGKGDLILLRQVRLSKIRNGILEKLHVNSSAAKKECVISKIEASQVGSSYVYVTFSDPNDYKSGNPFGPRMMAYLW
jgi:hypothetical protein